jgi:flagellar hook assembly protein FlgD
MRIVLTVLVCFVGLCAAHPGHDHSHDNEVVQLISWEDPQSIIDRVRVSPKSFDPSMGQEVIISYRIKEDAEVHVDIFDETGVEIVAIDRDVKAGEHSVTWDGNTQGGRQAFGDVFLYTIKAITKGGKTYLYNPASLTGGISITPLEYKLDKEAGIFEFVLPKAAKVRIQTKLESGMHEHAVLSWKPFPAGRHTVRWDGKDMTGTRNLLKRSDLDVRLACFTLPDNAILFSGTVVPHSDFDGTLYSQREHVWGTEGKSYHYRHLPYICREPRFLMSFPGSEAFQGGIKAVAGYVPVRIEIAPSERQHLINTRFKVQLYVDGVFLYETVDATTPFNVLLDTQNFTPGKHVLTANVLSYDDHNGALSQLIQIGE